MEVVTQKQKVLWNMMGSLCNALSSMILAIIVNRIAGGEAGGIFAFAFSNAQLMYTIGAFEIRPLQSTDVDEKFSFSDYVSLRLITCALMMACTTVYVLASGFSMFKAVTIWVVCLYKMVEAVADVFAGMFQQHDRIDLSGKTSTFRPVCSTVVFGITLYLTKNLILGAAAMVFVSTALFFGYDIRLKRIFENAEYSLSFVRIRELLAEAVPMFIAAFINMYMSNAPKYAIDSQFSEEMQNYYNIIFMPAFVINLFSLFAFRPLLTELARDWNEKKLKPFLRIIRNILLWIGFLTVTCMAGAYIIGARILGLVYGVSVMEFRTELVWVMAAGGISAVATFLYYVVTVMRRQRLLLLGYGFAFVCALIVPRILVPVMELFGAAVSYGASVLILSITFAVIVIGNVKKAKG